MSEPCFVPFLDKDAIDKSIEQAQARGYVFPIATELKVVNDAGVDFYYQIAISLVKKAQSAKTAAKKEFFDPFANPPEEQIAYTFNDSPHKLVLNRFNVVSRHLLLVTNAFEHQLEVPSLYDLEAIYSCLSGLDSVVTFNCGIDAGASQPHKHFHVLPRPLIKNAPSLPLGTLIRRSCVMDHPMTMQRVPELADVRHAAVSYNGTQEAFNEAFKLATSIIKTRFVDAEAARSVTTMTLPDLPSGDLEVYDECFIFVCTHDFIFVYPRSSSSWDKDGSSFNSISCTGCFFFPSFSQEEKFSERYTPIEGLKMIGYKE